MTDFSTVHEYTHTHTHAPHTTNKQAAIRSIILCNRQQRWLNRRPGKQPTKRSAAPKCALIFSRNSPSSNYTLAHTHSFIDALISLCQMVAVIEWLAQHMNRFFLNLILMSTPFSHIPAIVSSGFAHLLSSICVGCGLPGQVCVCARVSMSAGSKSAADYNGESELSWNADFLLTFCSYSHEWLDIVIAVRPVKCVVFGRFSSPSD